MLVDDMIEETRMLLDETNTEDVSDNQIIKALNRGARKCYNIVQQQYDMAMMKEKAVTTDGTKYLEIPYDSFGRKVEYISYSQGSNYHYKLQLVTPAKFSVLPTDQTSGLPQMYTIMENKILLWPTPQAGINCKIGYSYRPADLDKSQGRIISISGNTIRVDDAGEKLSTTVNDLGAFITLVNQNTGDLVGHLQIASISNDLITIKTSGLDRTRVLSYEIGTSIPATLGVDDYVCAIGKTCIMPLIDYRDYVTQYAVVEIKRSLRLPLNDDAAQLKELEKELVSMWSGRESSVRIIHKNTRWDKRN